jgi:hypothetical protein
MNNKGESFRNKIRFLDRPRLHGTGRIWNRAEIRPFRPCKHTRTTEPDEFETP